MSAACQPLLVLLLLSTASEAKPNGYPRGDLLIGAADLAKPAVGRTMRILDCRGKGQYLEGHVPGAVWLDAVTWMRRFGEGEGRDDWSKRIGALGIDADTRLVVYDDSRAKDAARIWWILRYWGVRDVRVLNGGWRAWKAAGGAVELGENRPSAVDARLSPQPRRLARRSDVTEQLDGKGQIVDARSTEEYCGTAQTAKRNGAIPGAVHLEWSDTMDRDGHFKSAAELAHLFRGAGIDPSRPTITYCQSGGRAAVMAFVLELMGGEDVRNYYRSWNEWGNAEDTPVARPSPKKP